MFEETLNELKSNLDKYMESCVRLVQNGQTMQVQEAVSTFLNYLFAQIKLTFAFLGVQICV